MALTNKNKFFIFSAIGIVAIYLLRNALFSAEQIIYLRNLNPRGKAKFKKFINRVKKETGFDIIITSGYRSFSKQDKLHDEDSNNAKSGDSYHNYGLAIDINATNGKTFLRKASSISRWKASVIPKIAKEMGISWGGNFKSYHDPVHFYIADRDIKTLKSIGYKKFGSNPKNIKGNMV